MPSPATMFRWPAVLLLLAAPLSVHAQSAPGPVAFAAARTDPKPRTLARGDTVRVSAAGLRLQGVIARVTADSMVLRVGGEERVLEMASVQGVARFAGRGPRGRAMLRGALVGALTGAGLGALLSGQTKELSACRPVDSSSASCVSSPDPTLHAALIAEGVILGGLVGTMTGPALRRSHWEPLGAVDGAPLQVALSPRSGALALQLRLAR